jgi:hypothetical protein
MSDITMCSGEGCELKFKCHRFTAKRSDYQSYFSKEPIKNGECEMFWGNLSEQIYVDLWDIVKGKLK